MMCSLAMPGGSEEINGLAAILMDSLAFKKWPLDQTATT